MYINSVPPKLKTYAQVEARVDYVNMYFAAHHIFQSPASFSFKNSMLIFLAKWVRSASPKYAL